MGLWPGFSVLASLNFHSPALPPLSAEMSFLPPRASEGHLARSFLDNHSLDFPAVFSLNENPMNDVLLLGTYGEVTGQNILALSLSPSRPFGLRRSP